MTTRPGLFDYVDLFILRAAKADRAKRESDEQFYDTFFTGEDVEKYMRDVRNRFRLQRIGAVYVALFGERPVRVVDVGCGLGMASRALPLAADYLGIEYSAHTLALARSAHMERGAKFVRGGFPTLPVANASADLVLSMEVVEHIPDDAQAVAEMARITKPGGHLLFTVPSTWYWPDYERLIGHYRHYTRASILSLLAPAGFEIVRGYGQFEGFWRGYHYLYVWLKAYEALLRKTIRRNFSVLDTAFYRWLSRRVERHLAARERDDDAHSTFVLCRRVGKSGDG